MQQWWRSPSTRRRRLFATVSRTHAAIIVFRDRHLSFSKVWTTLYDLLLIFLQWALGYACVVRLDRQNVFDRRSSDRLLLLQSFFREKYTPFWFTPVNRLQSCYSFTNSRVCVGGPRASRGARGPFPELRIIRKR